MEALADATDQPAPDLSLAAASGEESDDEEEGEGAEGLSLWQGGEGDGGASAALGPFGDDESRQFYTRLPDLLASVPCRLLGLSELDAAALKERRAREAREGDDADALAAVEALEDSAAGAAREASGHAAGEGGPGDDGGGAGGALDDDEDDEDDEDGEDEFGTFDAVEEAKAAAETSSGSSARPASTAQKLLAVLTDELPLCHSLERTDALVHRFVDLTGAANKVYYIRGMRTSLCTHGGGFVLGTASSLSAMSTATLLGEAHAPV